jgi:hypothetical protein
MGLFAKTAWAAQVLITAAMTLVAGIPRFDCRCSEAQVKPFSLALAASGSQCCCGRCGASSGSGERPCCMAASLAKRTMPASCCEASGVAPPSQPSPGGSQITQSACCLKTLAQPEIATPVNTIRILGKVLIPHAVFAYQTIIPLSFATSGAGQPVGSLHSLAPPADLVTLLQHFLI